MESGIWYWFISWLARVCFFVLTGSIERRNLENIPKSGSVIFAPIHVSHLDPPLIGSISTRKLRFMAKDELFRNRIFGLLIRSLGAFPVKRGTGDSAAIKQTLEWLEEGRAVIVFPEGQRGDGVTMNPLQSGVAVLAKRSGAAVLPIGIAGSHIVFPRGAKKLKRHKIVVVFGKPFTYSDTAKSQNDKENRASFNAELSLRIQEACHEAGLDLKSAD